MGKGPTLLLMLGVLVCAPLFLWVGWTYSPWYLKVVWILIALFFVRSLFRRAARLHDQGLKISSSSPA